jgi:hypothetical protein
MDISNATFDREEITMENEIEIDELEAIVAVITGAIASIRGKSTGDFVVRNIKRTASVDSLWAFDGRMKLMR